MILCKRTKSTAAPPEDATERAGEKARSLEEQVTQEDSFVADAGLLIQTPDSLH